MDGHIFQKRMIRAAGAMVAALTFFACNLPQAGGGSPAPPKPTMPASKQVGPSTVEPAHTSTPKPAPTPLPSELVWYGPNMGSRDYPDLFTNPEQWGTARSRINVFQFFSQNVLTAPCAICGDNTRSTFANAKAFEILGEWGIPIAIEAGAVKEWGCTGDDEFRVTSEAIDGVRQYGGEVTFVAMDEPYIGGQLVAGGNTCGYSMEQTADAAANYIGKVRENYPNVIVGDIEPYPYFSAGQLEDWTKALEARGATPEFFHLDVNMVEGGGRIDVGRVKEDLQRLQGFFDAQGIAFGVIFTANANWGVQTDQGYYQSTMEWLRLVQEAIGKPQHVIFESWLGPAPGGRHEVPINLPESDPSIYSHTRLILDGLDALGP